MGLVLDRSNVFAQQYFHPGKAREECPQSVADKLRVSTS